MPATRERGLFEDRNIDMTETAEMAEVHRTAFVHQEGGLPNFLEASGRPGQRHVVKSAP